MKTALWRAVKQAQPNLTDKEVDRLLQETAQRERRLVLEGMPIQAAQELIREELFPPDLDPWAGDAQYGPPR